MLIFVMRLRTINIKMGKDIGEDIYEVFMKLKLLQFFQVFLGMFHLIKIKKIRKMVKSIGYIF